MASLTELKLDIEELESLTHTAQRPKVKECLIKEISRLRMEVKRLEPKPVAQEENKKERTQVLKGYQETITNYAWDQSDKFMKLYLSLDSLSSITDDNISSTFTNKSVKVSIQFPNKCSNLLIAKLCEEIEAKESYVKKKSDYVLVMLKKKDIGKTWAYVTQKEKEKKDKLKDSVSKDEDPSAGLTKMLQNMYEDGDDDMKRTIAKAFYESQTKQRGGGDGPDPLAGL